MLSIIEARRDNKTHSAEDLRYLADGAASGSIPDYQLSAWLMAAVLNPMNLDETADLTVAMTDSGDRLDLSGLPKPWVDKHSTGGVGDKTTIALLPLLVSCGLTMVKMSGAGLGITGGTVDKLQSIPGFRMDLSPEEMKQQAMKIGIAITGQTPRLAPADKALYALRDVTGTVKSIPLIASSILSKKLAGGAETIVIDLKVGCGGFMSNLEEAKQLSETMLAVAERVGLNLKIAMTDMNSVLGYSVGNALEVQEAVEFLQGKLSNRFSTLCLELASYTLEACQQASSMEVARGQLDAAIQSRQAYSKFCDWVQAQGGDPTALDRQLPKAAIQNSVQWKGETGIVIQIRADEIGRAVVELGGGRKKKTDIIDLSVGIELRIEPGSIIRPGQTIAVVHAQSPEASEVASQAVLNAVLFSDSMPNVNPIVETS